MRSSLMKDLCYALTGTLSINLEIQRIKKEYFNITVKQQLLRENNRISREIQKMRAIMEEDQPVKLRAQSRVTRPRLLTEMPSRSRAKKSPVLAQAVSKSNARLKQYKTGNQDSGLPFCSSRITRNRLKRISPIEHRTPIRVAQYNKRATTPLRTSRRDTTIDTDNNIAAFLNKIMRQEKDSGEPVKPTVEVDPEVILRKCETSFRQVQQKEEKKLMKMFGQEEGIKSYR